MRAQMHAVVDMNRTVGGQPASLASLGFNWISMDDGWQRCNCSASSKPPTADPALPKCPNCKQGGCKWHNSAGQPVVDTRKFPNMKVYEPDDVMRVHISPYHRLSAPPSRAARLQSMVDYGHSLGLKVGSYLNNCICMEGGDPPMGKHCVGQTHYQEDVDFIISTGFDVHRSPA
jgi:hypothetical protein|eukprot:COSAG01_NODE_2159_length_8277_cov_416.997065_11_plen_174_part_00